MPTYSDEPHSVQEALIRADKQMVDFIDRYRDKKTLNESYLVDGNFVSTPKLKRGDINPRDSIDNPDLKEDEVIYLVADSSGVEYICQFYTGFKGKEGVYGEKEGINHRWFNNSKAVYRDYSRVVFSKRWERHKMAPTIWHYDDIPNIGWGGHNQFFKYIGSRGKAKTFPWINWNKNPLEVKG